MMRSEGGSDSWVLGILISYLELLQGCPSGKLTTLHNLQLQTATSQGKRCAIPGT